MRVALLALTLGIAAQPAFAQWGLYGFSASGLVYEIDEFTGDIALVGDIGVPIVDAISDYRYYEYQSVLVLTVDDQILSVNLRNLETTVLVQLTGRPSGYVPVAFGGNSVVLRPPAGDDILYAIDWNGAAYSEIGPIGLNDVSGMSYWRLCTTSGGVYDFNSVTGQTSLAWSITNGDRIEAISSAGCGEFVTGEGLYILRHLSPQPVQMRATGFADISALAYSSAFEYACLFDAGQPSECNIFDFLSFQNYFVHGDPLACDCDTSTGSGVCDIFDFLCFQNAFVIGWRVENGCR